MSDDDHGQHDGTGEEEDPLDALRARRAARRPPRGQDEEPGHEPGDPEDGYDPGSDDGLAGLPPDPVSSREAEVIAKEAGGERLGELLRVGEVRLAVGYL